MKIALGAAQFGLTYGIANQVGRVQHEDVQHILQLAAAQGVNTLDTAVAYGDSESTLGQAGVADWNVVTKLPAIPEGCVDVAGWVETQVVDSLERLKINQLYGVLLHRPKQLLGDNGQRLSKALQHIKAQGLTRKTGVSVYGPAELDNLKDEMQFDLVQAPLSILDQRLVTSGWAERLKKQGAELHVRSVFLQGLLLMETAQRPEKFARWQAVWREWKHWLHATGLTPLQACLAYVLSMQEVDQVVVGVDSVKQINEILDATHATLPSLPNWAKPVDTVLLNPARWNTL